MFLHHKTEDADVLGGHAEDDNAVVRKTGRSDAFILRLGDYKRQLKKTALCRKISPANIEAANSATASPVAAAPALPKVRFMVTPPLPQIIADYRTISHALFTAGKNR